MNIKNLVLAKSPKFVNDILVRIETSQIGSRFAKGVFWSLTGTVISRSLGLMASIIVARELGVKGFGELGVIQSTIGMFSTFAGLGLGLTATKFLAEFRLKDPIRAGRILTISGVVALVSGISATILLIIFAPWLAKYALNSPEMESLLRAGAWVLMLGTLTGAQNGALGGLQAFKTIAKLNFIGGLANFPLMVGGVYLAGVYGAVWGMVAASVFSWCLNHYAIRKEALKSGIKLQFKDCWQEYKILYQFSLPALLAGVMVGPVNWLCTAMLVNQPDGYREMGVFNAANQWFNLILFIPGIVGQVALPIFSEQFSDKGKFKKIIYFSIKLNFWLSVPLVLVLSLASPFIMSLYGHDFSHGYWTLIAVLVTGVLFCLQTPVGHAIAASNSMWVGFYMNLAWALMFILLTYLSLNYGSLGLASSRAIAYLAHSVWGFYYMNYLINSKIPSLFSDK